MGELNRDEAEHVEVDGPCSRSPALNGCLRPMTARSGRKLNETPNPLTSAVDLLLWGFRAATELLDGDMAGDEGGGDFGESAIVVAGVRAQPVEGFVHADT